MPIISFDTFLTPRITAERLRPEHIDLIHRMHQDDDVMAKLGGRRYRQETQDYMEHNLAHWQTHGFGIWILRQSASGRFMGRGGLRNTVFEGKPEVEVAYGLLPEYWNQGLATEFTRHVVQIGSGRLGLSELVSITVPANLASQRVLTKAGFQHERDIVYKGQVHLLYRWRPPVRQSTDSGDPASPADMDFPVV